EFHLADRGPCPDREFASRRCVRVRGPADPPTMTVIASAPVQPSFPLVGGGDGLEARSPARMALRRFRGQRLAMFGLILLGIICALAVLAPLIAPADPLKVDLAFFRKPPGPVHPLGTDSAGRDVLSRLLFAGQVSLTVGLV